LEQKSFQSFLNKILPEYPDDLIQPTYQEIFEGLDKEQKNFLGQILLDNPKIIVAFVYSYTPTKDYELRDELLNI
jgi:hypothetical protein